MLSELLKIITYVTTTEVYLSILKNFLVNLDHITCVTGR